jgi:hypothetical protein
MHRYAVLVEDRQARRVEALAGQYGLTEQEVLRQLVEVGLDTVEERADANTGDERHPDDGARTPEREHEREHE